MENAKVYVEVLVNFDKDGTMSPVEILSGKMEKNIMWTVSLQRGNACAKPKSRRNRESVIR